MDSAFIQVITIISAIYGVLLFLIHIYRFLLRIGAFVKEPHIFANQFFKYVDKIVEEVKKNGIPDMIVGVGRGGSIVAATLSANILNHGKPIPISTIEWGFNKDGDKFIKPTTNVDFKDMNVIVCLAEDYFGELVTKAKSFLKKKGAVGVKSVSVYSTFPSMTSRMGKTKYKAPDIVGVLKTKKCKLPWEGEKYCKTSKN